MENSKNSNILQQFQEAHSAKIISIINELREEGSDQVLEILAKYYLSTSDAEVRNAISRFFCDLQNQSSAAVIVELINNQDYQGAKQMLVSSCWQTRINYILYLETFIELVFNEPFEIAFEAFTVIENIDSRVSEGRKNELIAFIESRIDSCRDENLVLADDIAAIVRQYEE